MNEETFSIGFTFGPKKMNSFKSFFEYLEKEKITYFFFDFKEFKFHKHVDIVVHKINDLMIADKNISTKFQKYLNDNKLRTIDNVECINDLLNREIMYSLFLKIFENESSLIKIPKFRMIKNEMDIEILDMNYPLICKNIIGSGNNSSHEMSLIYKKEDLLELFKLNESNSTILIQQLITHSVVHKIYNIGNDIYFEERSSINELLNNKSKLFNSQHLKNEIDKKEEDIDKEKIKEISKILKKEFKLNLFGFDILIEKETNDYFLIDLNHFPGYKNIKNLNEIFLNFLRTY
eukprot:gene9896-2218_t